MSIASTFVEATPPDLGRALDRVDGVERRACAKALQFWREIGAPRRMPAVGKVDERSAGALWPHLFLVEWPGEFAAARIVLAGSVLAAAIGRDPTGLTMREAWPASSLPRVRFLQETAAELKTPIDEAGRWRCADSECLYRCIWLPLSDDQRVVTHLLGAMSFRTLRFT